MSSKKARRRQRQMQKQEGGRKARNPAMLFIVGIAVALMILVGGAYLFANPPSDAPENPPNPGAVSSSSLGVGP